ncbi:hypothetical protein P12x_001632 [Tundrisphaera lichenicola]|uniref:hypothetical protein n=1 Tax=Tundrisphaera lichenicola TaxID=2029860 RepID=UPI003EBD3B05
MDIIEAFNLAEAGLWAAFAAATVTLGHRVRGMTPWLRGLFFVAFLAFGLSDLIEIGSGAWWRPPGLLILKGVCLTSLVLGVWQISQNRRALASIEINGEEVSGTPPPGLSQADQ